MKAQRFNQLMDLARASPVTVEQCLQIDIGSLFAEASAFLRFLMDQESSKAKPLVVDTGIDEGQEENPNA